eukprot:144331-Chlamydomonas_euryale.AAC.1
MDECIGGGIGLGLWSAARGAGRNAMGGGGGVGEGCAAVRRAACLPVRGAACSPVRGAARSPVRGAARSPVRGATRSQVRGAACSPVRKAVDTALEVWHKGQAGQEGQTGNHGLGSLRAAQVVLFHFQLRVERRSHVWLLHAYMPFTHCMQDHERFVKMIGSHATGGTEKRRRPPSGPHSGEESHE